MTVVAFSGVLEPLQMFLPQFVDVTIKKHAPTRENATKRRKHPFVVPFPSRPAPGEPYLSWLPFHSRLPVCSFLFSIAACRRAPVFFHSRLPACSFLFSIAAFRRAPFSWPVGGQYYLNTPFFSPGENYTMFAVENFSFRAPGRFAVVFFTLRGNSIFQGFTSGADR